MTRLYNAAVATESSRHSKVSTAAGAPMPASNDGVAHAAEATATVRTRAHPQAKSRRSKLSKVKVMKGRGRQHKQTDRKQEEVHEALKAGARRQDAGKKSFKFQPTPVLC